MQIADPDPAGVGIPGRNEDEEEYSNYDDEYIETSICGFDIMLTNDIQDNLCIPQSQVLSSPTNKVKMTRKPRKDKLQKPNSNLQDSILNI